jgi:WD40 repeat protein
VSTANPYKGLEPFRDTEQDALYFFGRDREHGIIASNLTAARLTLLYGPSGVGKSSILRAGVVRRLRALPGPLGIVVFDAWRENPGLRLREAVAEAAGSEPEGSLADVLEAACARVGGEVYVILDGAEEYFVYHGTEEEPGTFAADFPAAVTRPGLRAYFLLCLREDALAELDRFKSRVPALFANSLRLEHLDRPSARQAIVGPVDQFNRLSQDGRVEIEPALVDAVLDQVATGKVELGYAGRGTVRKEEQEDRVETPFLSLVMERLWEAEQAGGSNVLRLRTLEELGGAEQIVRDHLEEALESLPAESQEVAAEVFNHLVTPSGTKIAHGVADLAGYAGVEQAALAPVLQALASERILRPVAGTDGSQRYEIFHDVLAGAVLTWRSGWAAQRELERERRAGRKRVRRLLAVVAVALVALAAMAALAVWALAQRSDARRESSRANAAARRAETEAGRARTEARRALGRELAASALSQLSVDPELSLLLGIEAAKRDPSFDATDVLRQALVASRVRSVLRAGGAPVRSVAFSPGGTRLVTAAMDGKARIFSLGGRLLHVLSHRGAVTDASFSSDGRLVATASADGTAGIWRADSGARLQILRHDGPVESEVLSPDGRLIVTASDDRTVRIWRTETGRLLRVITLARPLRTAFFSPGGRLVVAVDGREARIFEVATGNLFQVLQQRGLVTSAAFSPNGELVATGSADRTARIWNAVSGRLVHELDDHRGRVVGVSFSPRGRLLVTASTDGAARVWRVRTGARVTVVSGHTNPITSAGFSPDGRWVVTSSRDRTAGVAKSGSGRPWVSFLGHAESVDGAVFSPDGRLVATASEDGTARVWDARTYPDLVPLGAHDRPANIARFSPDGRLAVSAGDDGTGAIWDVRTRKLVARLKHDAPVVDAAFSRDGKLVATASRDGTARLWSRGGRLLRILRHRAPVFSVRFSPVAALVVTAGGDTAKIWQTHSGTLVHVLGGPGAAVLGAEFSGDGRLVVTWSADRTARIWRARDGRLSQILRGHERLVTAAAFSPDGSRLVTASADETARIWDVRTGAVLHVLRGHRGALTSAEFSPDGQLVVTASLDHDARIWDVATGKTLHVLRGHFAFVNGASFSPNGRWVVTAGPGTAGLWPTSTGVLQDYLYGHKGPLDSAVFSPDGKVILTAGRDGTIRTYRCDICGNLPELVAFAKSRLARTGRVLTPAERAKYLHG